MAAINYQTARFEASYGTVAQLPASTTPEVAVAGRSNVGKSSLLNKLFGRKGLVKVSATPGKTANINFFEVDGKRRSSAGQTSSRDTLPRSAASTW